MCKVDKHDIGECGPDAYYAGKGEERGGLTRRLRAAFASAADTLADLLFPPRCPFCDRVVFRGEACAACREDLPRTAGRSGFRAEADGFVCAAPLRYEGTVREAILRMKFHGRGDAAKPLGALVAACAAQRYPAGFDAVTWVPVSRKRLRERGFDQARLLAEGVCRYWRKQRTDPLDALFPERLIVKRRDNPAQSGLRDASLRRANVSGVYAITPGAQIRRRRILLVDDVCTTGATLRECRETLLQGGAESVVCAAVALTEERRRKPTHEERRRSG